ncbi:NUDIX domain-containing protein [Enterococcus songbeiensis]|uniref:NUDIX domain-containing protein n=1 Tax=Enterococcus songbeiensis TaxID=2559927 RepID=UPI0010FA159F|nr:NUDIX domain-containing protein [Enterococcus songbeiensis]
MLKKSIECWIYNQKINKFLLLEVDDTKIQFWQPITGGIEMGESAKYAAIREVYEETGLIISSNNIFKIGVQRIRIDDNLVIDKTLFLTIVDKEKIIISNEHINWRWEEKKEVIEALHWENNIQSFNKTLQILNKYFHLSPPPF